MKTNVTDCLLCFVLLKYTCLGNDPNNKREKYDENLVAQNDHDWNGVEWP